MATITSAAIDPKPSTYDPEMTQEASRHLLGYFNDPRGYMPGNFTTKLIDAWFHADRTNGAKLAVAFPYLGRAMETYDRHGLSGLAEDAE